MDIKININELGELINRYCKLMYNMDFIRNNIIYIQTTNDYDKLSHEIKSLLNEVLEISDKAVKEKLE